MLAAGGRAVGCRKLLPSMPSGHYKDLFQLIAPNTISVGDSRLELEVRVRLKAAAYKAGGSDWANLFRHLDKDNSGFIEFEEFRDMCRRVLKLSTKDHNDDELLQVFMAVDADGDAQVSVEEMIEFVRN